MAEGEADTTEYDRLVKEFASTPGPLEGLVKPITDGIEMEAFAATRAGKNLIGMAMDGARAALLLIVDPNVAGNDLHNAVIELRVRHRVLDFIKSTLTAGKNAERRVRELDDQSRSQNGSNDL